MSCSNPTKNFVKCFYISYNRSHQVRPKIILYDTTCRASDSVQVASQVVVSTLQAGMNLYSLTLALNRATQEARK
jgi:hypothetical protein